MIFSKLTFIVQVIVFANFNLVQYLSISELTLRVITNTSIVITAVAYSVVVYECMSTERFATVLNG
jgi:hypothetical protein